MRIRLGYFTPLLGSVATVVAIAAGPIASAAPSASPATPQQACAGSSARTVCQSPGNVQVFVAPPQVDYDTFRGGAT
jgi:hypothetical protein